MIDRAAEKRTATHRLPQPSGARGGAVRPGSPARADRDLRSLRHRSA
jgi:hypothetical protein